MTPERTSPNSEERLQEALREAADDLPVGDWHVFACRSCGEQEPSDSDREPTSLRCPVCGEYGVMRLYKVAPAHHLPVEPSGLRQAADELIAVVRSSVGISSRAPELREPLERLGDALKIDAQEQPEPEGPERDELRAAVEAYLAVDGYRGDFDAFERAKARDRLDALLAEPHLEGQEQPEPTARDVIARLRELYPSPDMTWHGVADFIEKELAAGRIGDPTKPSRSRRRRP